MIELSRLNGSPVVVNADVIAWIESTPDTIVCLLNGEKLMVRESREELVRRVVAYRQQFHTGIPENGPLEKPVASQVLS